MIKITCSTGAGTPESNMHEDMHYWTSQGVGYTYIAGGGPQT